MLDSNGLVIRDINKRWESGQDHHKDSKKLFRALLLIDNKYCHNFFDWKSGGDGDNGEMLMYEMDVFFECMDNGEPLSKI